MKTNDVVVGQQYFARVNGWRVRVTVLQRSENLTRTWDVHGGAKLIVKFRCMNMYTGREVIKSARQLTPAPAPLSVEQAMDALVAYADGGSMPSQEQLRASFVAMVVEQSSAPACVQAQPSKPTVTSYTDDGLPIPG